VELVGGLGRAALDEPLDVAAVDRDRLGDGLGFTLGVLPHQVVIHRTALIVGEAVRKGLVQVAEGQAMGAPQVVPIQERAGRFGLTRGPSHAFVWAPSHIGEPVAGLLERYRRERPWNVNQRGRDDRRLLRVYNGARSG
jgi:hypothetical protein